MVQVQLSSAEPNKPPLGASRHVSSFISEKDLVFPKKIQV